MITEAPKFPQSRREIIHRNQRGIGVIVVDHRTGNILAVEEQHESPARGKGCGDLSILLETRKKGESTRDNMLGALAEAFDDVDLTGRDIRGLLTDGLHMVNGDSIVRRASHFTSGIRQLECDVAVIVYDSPVIPQFRSSNADETRPVGFVPMSRLLGAEARPLARQVVQFAQNEGYIDRVLNLFQARPQERVQVLPPGFSFRTNYARRERLADV